MVTKTQKIKPKLHLLYTIHWQKTIGLWLKAINYGPIAKLLKIAEVLYIPDNKAHKSTNGLHITIITAINAVIHNLHKPIAQSK